MIKFPVTIVRKNLLDTEWLNKLASNDVYTKYKFLYNKRNAYKIRKEKVVDDIEVLASRASGQEKSDLVAIKRTLFNDRYKNICFDNISERKLKDNLKILKKEYYLIGKIELDFSKYIKEQELAERRLLYDIANNNSIRNSLNYLSNSALCGYDKYIAKTPEEHNKKNRKFDYYLLKILTRATVKTSPFSTLTTTHITLRNDEKKEKIVRTQINYKWILEVYNQLLKFEEFLEKSNFHINDTLEIEENTIVYTASINNERNYKVFETTDALVKTTRTKFINELIEKFKVREILTYKELTSICEKNNVLNQVELINKLIEKKLIIIEKQVFESDNMLEDLILLIENIDSDNIIVKKIKESLLIINQLVNKINYDAVGNQQILPVLKCEMNKIDEIVHIKFNSDEYFYQDSVYFESDSEDYYLDSVDDLCIFMRLFDGNIFLQQIFSEFVYKKYGVRKIDLSKSEEIIREIVNLIIKYAPQLSNVNLDNYIVEDYNSELINKFSKLRKWVISDIKNCIKNKRTLRISKELIEKIRGITKLYELSFSNSVFFQKSKNLIVLNNFYPGYLAYFNRFLVYFPNIYNDLEVKKYISYLNDIKKITDLYYIWGFNGNNRRLITDKVIRIPNHFIPRKYDSRVIRMDELFIGVDEKRQLSIFDSDSQTRIKTIFQGSVIKSVIPSLAATLDTISNNGSVQLSLSKQVINYVILNLFTDDVNDDIFVPEILLDNILLSRKKSIFKNDFFGDISSEQLYEIISKILNYLKKSGFSTKVMITFANIEEKNNEKYVNLEKPQYFDFTSILFTKMFIKELKKYKYIIIEELLPTLQEENCEYVQEYTN